MAAVSAAVKTHRAFVCHGEVACSGYNSLSSQHAIVIISSAMYMQSVIPCIVLLSHL